MKRHSIHNDKAISSRCTHFLLLTYLKNSLSGLRRHDQTPTICKSSTDHSGVLVAALAVAERGGERRRAALVVAGRLAVVGGRVDRNGPHAGRVAVTVAVVVVPAVARRPHVDGAETATALG